MEGNYKERVLALRARGLTYKGISAATGIPVGTVKSICHRNPPPKEGRCEWCGKPLARAEGKKRRRFCCDACRFKWHGANPDPSRTAVCANCGASFVLPRGKRQRYCSQACYREARYGKGK